MDIEKVPEDLQGFFTADGHAFVLRVKDDSRAPDLMKNDQLIISPNTTPKNGSLVFATIAGKKKATIRKFDKHHHGLKILGVVVGLRRFL
jgi:SOS-response transcriptional repressor LexA